MLRLTRRPKSSEILYRGRSHDLKITSRVVAIDLSSIGPSTFSHEELRLILVQWRFAAFRSVVGTA